MSTRSIIAKWDGVGGFVGRFAHWDGYPQSQGARLWNAYQELGSPEELRAYALREGYRGQWETFMPPTEAAESSLDSSRSMFVAKGWVHYKDDELEDWFTSGLDDMGAEWAYVIDDQALLVLEPAWSPDLADETACYGYWALKGWVSWDGDEPDWESFENGPGISLTDVRMLAGVDD